MRGAPLSVTLMALLAASALLAGAACDDGAPPSASPTVADSSPATSPSPTGPSAAATASPTATPFEWSRGPVEKGETAPVPPGALLVDVRTGRHKGFDRIVFEFSEGLPGYRIEYVAPPIVEDASGLLVEIRGNAFLRVSFRGAGGFDPSSGEPTYDGPDEIAAGLPSLLEAERTGDFEAVLTWMLGLNEQVDFRVSSLEDPSRVVIDALHP